MSTYAGGGGNNAGGPEPRADHVAALRKLRLEAARQRGMPAFRVLTDAGLFAIAQARPTSTDELLACRGIGNKFVERYGEETLRIFRADADAA
jgi:superfamily II DNA helicase RecQ